MSLRRMLPFIFLNILVSATVVLLLLRWWDTTSGNNFLATQPEVAATPGLTLEAVSEAATPLPASPVPTTASLIHIVQPGETLGDISQQYDVGIDTLMAINGMSDPNLLAVGQEIRIEAGETEPVPAEEAAEVIPTPASGDDTPAIVISEVAGAGRLADEVVLIVNNGPDQVALQGWRLVDQEQNVYTFGDVVLFGGGAGIRVRSIAGQDAGVTQFWGQEEAVWESGEMATLMDASGVVRATYQIP